MNLKDLDKLLADFKAGHVDRSAIIEKIKSGGIEDLNFANLDFHRELRQGFPEVIYCAGKTATQILEIARKIYARHGRLLATRAGEEVFEALQKQFPDLIFNPAARCIHSPFPESPKFMNGRCAIITAGTSDIPVAEEALVTCRMFGFQPETIFDVGVAGLHRLNYHWEKIRRAKIIIVIAGMEGALASVVGGLVDKPVIAVPTSVGYGTSFNGVAALLGMLNSCSSNVTAVNIDNGFGAAFSASLFLRQLQNAFETTINNGGDADGSGE